MTSTLNYDQNFNFCGQNLSGISDLTFVSNFGVGLTTSLGNRHFGFAKVEPAAGSVEFSRSLIYADPVLAYTGDSACSGQFSYNGTSYGFESGYLTNYSVNCSVGQIPSVSSSFQVFGEMKSGAANQTFVAHPDIFVPSPKSITVSNDYSSSNRVTSFDYSVSCPRLPKRSVGEGLFPVKVFQQLPLRVSSSVTFNVRGFSSLDLQHFVRQISSPSFNIEIKNRTLSEALMVLPVQNAQITNQQLQGTVDSPLSVVLSYEGYLE